MKNYVNYLKPEVSYFKREANKFVEFKISTIKYVNNEFLYNENEQYDLNSVFTRNETGEFVEAKTAALNLKIGEQWAMINGVATQGMCWFKSCEIYPKKNSASNVAIFCPISEDGCYDDINCFDISVKRLFPNKELAVESEDITIEHLDGSTETKKGILNLVALNEDQKALLAELKQLLQKAKELDLTFIGSDITDSIVVYNTQYISVLTKERCDLNDGEIGLCERDLFSLKDTLGGDLLNLPNTQWINDDEYYKVAFSRKSNQ